MLVYLVADYGAGDLAFAEVIQALDKELPKTRVVPVPVPTFDTMATGFVVGQLAKGEKAIIYHNTAPRRDNTGSRKNNDGEKLGATWVGETLVVGANAGHCFSFLPGPVFSLLEDNSGSQFRSRDIFPGAIAQLARGEKELGQELSVPDVPKNCLLYSDGYGNMKTSLEEQLLERERLQITIGGESHTAAVAGSAFAQEEGSLALVPGSSGHRQRYLEIFLRGGSAAELFAFPKNGEKITIKQER